MISRITTAPAAVGLERMAVFFQGHAFTPHRHDTYVIGHTTDGVQSFTYRGATRHSLPGQVFVLHPDEVHDGRAGDDAGFGYRALHIDPALIRAALGDRALPFLRNPVTDEPPLRAAVMSMLSDLDEPFEALRVTSAVSVLAQALAVAAGRGGERRRVDEKAVRTLHELLLASDGRKASLRDFEVATGLNRWTLARHFRAAYGVSPYRFLLLRRLDRARALIRAGQPLVEVALRLGFADQSHLTRHFRRAYGLAPGDWRELVAGVANKANTKGH